MAEGCSVNWAAWWWHARDNRRNEPWTQLGAGGVIGDRCWSEMWTYSRHVHCLTSV